MGDGVMQSEELLKNINDRLSKHRADLMVKRVFDLIVSIALLIVLMPLMIIIAIAIKIDSKGPVIFTQKRVGLNGRLFVIYKFRTMVKNAEQLFKLDIDKNSVGSFVFQEKNDSRVTKIGGFLRKTSLDELPQLLNVLIGSMSLVGPRQEIPGVADYYNDRQKLRLCVKPGITGLAQVSGRGEIELDRTIGYDLEYINKFSIWMDIKILFKTVFVVFKREGAY
jgi:exopolysaccharide biosynthesis polyprenyl glycosylphosphotransferase